MGLELPKSSRLASQRVPGTHQSKFPRNVGITSNVTIPSVLPALRVKLISSQCMASTLPTALLLQSKLHLSSATERTHLD